MNLKYLPALLLVALLGAGPRPAAAAAPPASVAVAAPLAAAPVITAFSPGYGAPGTTITLTGTDLDGATDVQLNGQSIAFALVSATSLTATVPAGAATGLLRVVTPDGAGESQTAFKVLDNGAPACGLGIHLPDVATTNIPVYVSGEAGTLGSGISLVAVDIALTHTWDADLRISLLSPAGQEVILSDHNGGSGDNYGYPADCPAATTHFDGAATLSILSGNAPFIGSFQPQQQLTNFNAGTANGVWTLRIMDTAGGDDGTLQYVKLTFAAPAIDLVVNTLADVPAGTYRDLTIAGTGEARLTGPVVVTRALTVENGGTLHTNCQPLTGAGTFTLAEGGTLTICDPAGIMAAGNTGAVRVGGARSFATGAHYRYVGAGAQQTGTGLPYAVRSLTQQNAASLTLTSSVYVAQALTLTSGTLETGNRVIDLGAAATLTEAGGYLLGDIVAYRTLTTAPDNFGGIGLTVAPDPARPAPGLTRVQRTTGTALATGGNHGIKRYYEVRPTGDLQNATLTLAYAEAELAGLDEASLDGFRTDNLASGSWQQLAAAQRDAAANTVTLSGLTQFGYLTLAGKDAPLPVQLVAFSAQAQGEAAVLRWTTAQELNNDRFEVEASADGRTFAKVGTVAGHGSSSTRHDYRFDDAQLTRYGAATVHYRLRQVDGDGSAHYSPVRTVAVGAPAAPGLAVYPTVLAAGEPLRYHLSGPAAGAELTVLSVTGQPLSRQPLTAEAGTVTLPALPAGCYLGRVQLATGQVLSTRFVVR